MTSRLAAILISASFSANAAITIDTSSSTDWKIGNGVLTVDWRPGDGRIFSMHWAAFPQQELIDQTNRDRNGPKGFYMDNVGPGSSTPSNNYYLDPLGQYVDWWVQFPSSSTNPFTWSQHYVLFANDPGIHIYFVLNHAAGDAAGSIGQIQWVFRGDLTQFANTYSVNSGLGNVGATAVPLPTPDVLGTTDPGRQAQDATVDLHGLPLPPRYRRQFYTKYDYSSYEYLHRAHGVYGGTMAAWMALPSQDTLTGGPTKQDLIFTGNLLIMEAYSNHLDNQMTFNVPYGDIMRRLYGPFYLHFNAFTAAYPTAASLYAESLSAADHIKLAYDGETELLNNGYTPSTKRGEVDLLVQGAGGISLNRAWAVLSDEGTDFQYGHAGAEYWQNIDPRGMTTFKNVVPGTYRVSVYVLGQFGELRFDGLKVSARRPRRLTLNFTPETFGPAPPIWNIGTPDRSSREFLHGTVSQPVDLDPAYSDEYTFQRGASIQDDRQYWGNWNYWADFAANAGAVVYYATPIGNNPATDDLTKWNYNQWRNFDPHLYGGIYNSTDDTTDGYQYICPSYAGDCVTAVVPDWQVHFAASAAQQGQGRYVVLSVGLAATESNLTVSLNGHPLVWHGFNLKNADAAVRSGFSGTYQWAVFQWDTSQLNPPGQDNVVTFHVDHTQGVMYDALRLEITGGSAAHEVTGWNDYEFLYGNTDQPANDSLSNNNR
jgi:hypothetical protein